MPIGFPLVKPRNKKNRGWKKKQCQVRGCREKNVVVGSSDGEHYHFCAKHRHLAK